jgi:hypothetical protein
MIDSVLKRYAAKQTDELNENPVDEAETLDDLGVFGFLRGTRDRALMLELRKKTGNVQAVGYAWLERAEFDASIGITLYIAGRKITIKGQNLNAEVRPNVRLFQGITRHRVPWIQEADQPTVMEAGGKGLIVDKIEW